MPRSGARTLPTLLRRGAQGVGDLLLTVGVTLLLFVVWQGWWTDVQANAQASDTLAQVRSDFAAAAPAAPSSPAPEQGSEDDRAPQETPGEPLPEPDPATFEYGDALAVAYLPTIGEERVVKEGTEGDVLNQGVLGHYPDTAGPGQVGNFALAGHRTTYGRPLWDLGEMAPGDPIVVETAANYHVYRFEELEVVDPGRWQVLAPVPGEPEAEPEEARMVLTACHPRFSAQERLIGYAVLDRSVPRSAGPPPELGDARAVGEG